MKKFVPAFALGVVFAIGLGLGGMTQPQKVIAFLDVTGAWDPALMWVMGGAVAVYGIFYRITMRRPKPMYDDSFHLPENKGVDWRLIIGSVMFGAGWGISGYCPAPALTALTTFQANAWIFVTAMLVGMILFKVLDKPSPERH